MIPQQKTKNNIKLVEAYGLWRATPSELFEGLDLPLELKQRLDECKAYEAVFTRVLHPAKKPLSWLPFNIHKPICYQSRGWQKVHTAERLIPARLGKASEGKAVSTIEAIDITSAKEVLRKKATKKHRRENARLALVVKDVLAFTRAGLASLGFGGANPPLALFDVVVPKEAHHYATHELTAYALLEVIFCTSAFAKGYQAQRAKEKEKGKELATTKQVAKQLDAFEDTQWRQVKKFLPLKEDAPEFVYTQVPRKSEQIRGDQHSYDNFDIELREKPLKEHPKPAMLFLYILGLLTRKTIDSEYFDKTAVSVPIGEFCRMVGFAYDSKKNRYHARQSIRKVINVLVDVKIKNKQDKSVWMLFQFARLRASEDALQIVLTMHGGQYLLGAKESYLQMPKEVQALLNKIVFNASTQHLIDTALWIAFDSGRGKKPMASVRDYLTNPSALSEKQKQKLVTKLKPLFDAHKALYDRKAKSRKLTKERKKARIQRKRLPKK